LTVYLLTDQDFDLPNLEIVAAKEITLAAASKLERTEMAIRAAVAYIQERGEKVTQAAVAGIAGISQGYLSRRFGKLLLLLLGDSNSKSNNSEVDDPPLEVVPLIWGAIDLAETPQALADTVADLLNGIVDPHHLLGLLLAGPPGRNAPA
jgi:hypothetical protein